jgi:hypothetical protein
MKKLILASVSAIALFGVAACSDTDGTTTQSVDPTYDSVTPAPAVPQDPATQPAPQAAPSDEGAADTIQPATPAPSE